MTYNLQQLKKDYDSGKKLKFLFFWGHKPHPGGDVTSSCFSQWWVAPFTVDENTYPTAEHWMMAEKARLFGDVEMLEKIIQAQSPAQAKKFGRQVRGFDQAIWENRRSEIVVEGNVHKFTQHPELKDFLINTKKRILVEASPRDTIWGIGLSAGNERAAVPLQWRGKNLLGFALMKVRDLLMN
ncbi:MAG: NADAR family protein [Roseivirga sp.]|nr:NADAR family protein [Roseivirga sp.]